MGSRYLTDLAAVVRAAGLTAEEEDGWQSRARGSGGYSAGFPCAVMIHHTASGPSSDGQPDVDYMCYRADARPIANLYLSRTGKVWVMAAGATNTNGSGGPLGPVPADSMNSSAIGIEAGNDGVGEGWTGIQQEVYITLCRALCESYAIPPDHIYSHAEWSPGRKVDPAGPSRWATSGTWPAATFRADVVSGWPGTPPPPASPKRKAAMYALYQCQEDGAMFASNMIECRWCITGESLQHYQAMLTAFGYDPVPVPVPRYQLQENKFGVPIGPLPWPPDEGTSAATEAARREVNP